MGWASISVRKMALKQRINQYEQRLMNISQELQSMYDASSYAQSAINLEKTRANSSLYTTYSNNTSTLQSQYGDASDVSSMSAYSTAMQEQQLSLQYAQMLNNSLYTAKETAMQEAINDQETALETEQEQVETQLEAARAEYQSLDEACSQDIQDGAIKLA